MFGGCVANHIFVGVHVVFPEAPLFDIGRRKFPIFFGAFEAVKEAAFLFLAGDVEEEFSDDDAVVSEVGFEIVDVFVALFPDVLSEELGRQLLFLEQLGVDTDDEDFFVIGAVKDPDASAFGEVTLAAPKVVVVKFFWRRSFERGNLAALGIEAGHDMFDGAVFTGGVHGLEDEEDGPTVVGVELVLERGKMSDAVLEHFFEGGFVF